MSPTYLTTTTLRVMVPLSLLVVAWIWREDTTTPAFLQTSVATITDKTLAWSSSVSLETLLGGGVVQDVNGSEATESADGDHVVSASNAAESSDSVTSADLCFPWDEGPQAPQSVCCAEDYCNTVRATTAYSICCRSSNTNATTTGDRKVHAMLITGTPRSGTVFVSSLLSSLGLRLANDADVPTAAGMVSWLHLYDDFHPDLWWTRPMDPATVFRHVVQQVRDPLASITSMAFTEPIGDERYIRFLARHIPITDPAITFTAHDTHQDALRIRRTLEFYTEWHSAIMELGVPRFRLEDFVQPNNTILPQLFAWAGKPPPDPAQVQLQMDLIRRRRHRRHLQQKVNHNQRKHRPTLEWDELCDVDVALTQRFFALSQTFGYYGNMTTVCGP